MTPNCVTSLELRMQLVEDELRKNKERNYEYTQAMERCVKVRDEQIITQKSEIERKDRIIAEITEKMNELQECRKKMEERTGTGNAAVAEIVGGSVGAPGSWKPKRKTRWEPISPNFAISMTVEPFVKYFVVKMEEGTKRQICPFQLKADLASQVGGAVESIRGSGKDSFLVTVYSKNQSDKIRCVKQIAGNNCHVSEAFF